MLITENHPLYPTLFQIALRAAMYVGSSSGGGTSFDVIVSWKGDSVPVVANIPQGISVTYQGTTYTGTMVASSDTKGKIYLVRDLTKTTPDIYDEYLTITEDSGSTYKWERIGGTAINLNNYYTKSEVDSLLLTTVRVASNYVADANAFYTSNAVGKTNTSTQNLPDTGYTQDNWGTLIYLSENDTDNTGVQIYNRVSYSGSTNRNQMWTRLIVNGVGQTWKRLLTTDDLQLADGTTAGIVKGNASNYYSIEDGEIEGITAPNIWQYSTNENGLVSVQTLLDAFHAGDDSGTTGGFMPNTHYVLGSKSATFSFELVDGEFNDTIMVDFDATGSFTPTCSSTIVGATIPACVSGKHYSFAFRWNGDAWEFDWRAY